MEALLTTIMTSTACSSSRNKKIRKAVNFHFIGAQTLADVTPKTNYGSFNFQNGYSFLHFNSHCEDFFGYCNWQLHVEHFVVLDSAGGQVLKSPTRPVFMATM